jgi:2-polyprenyl-3-methyl-5-hydroxy-6-metoxy-1,4-benzoquinol methylase
MRKWSDVRRIHPARISTEVVEHLYASREWAKGAFRALKPGGRLICTTIKAQRARKLESISRKLDIAV